jgi:hypothetical protein
MLTTYNMLWQDRITAAIEFAPKNAFMNDATRSSLRASARGLLLKLWKDRERIYGRPVEASALIPVPTEVIVRSVLSVELEEPEEIVSERRGYEVAGFMDRGANRIVVAQKYKAEWRRFTRAHEIAHWVIHPDVSYHRDRPITGAESSDFGRPEKEQAADFFAAELVMPEKPLTEYFHQVFGGRIDGRIQDRDLAAWLSVGTNRHVNEIELSDRLLYRALLISETRSCGPTPDFVPLAKKFGVSPTAMAIRLEGLGLVI